MVDWAGGPRLALALVRIASVLVPREVRARWRREWEGGLVGRWEELAAQRTTVSPPSSGCPRSRRVTSRLGVPRVWIRPPHSAWTRLPHRRVSREL